MSDQHDDVRDDTARSSTSDDVEKANHETQPGDRAATEASRRQAHDLERHGD